MGRDILFLGIKRERFVNRIVEVFDKYHLEVEDKLDFINRFQKQIKIHDLEGLRRYLHTKLPHDVYFSGVLNTVYDEFSIGNRTFQHALSDLLFYYDYQFTIDLHSDFYVEEFEEEMDEEVFKSENGCYVFYKIEFINIINWFIAVVNEYGDKENLNSKGVPFFELLNYQAKRWKDDYFITNEEERAESLNSYSTDSLIKLKENVLKADIDFLYWNNSY